jgi:plasmid maintenance system antidote protein VapI
MFGAEGFFLDEKGLVMEVYFSHITEIISERARICQEMSIGLKKKEKGQVLDRIL